MARSMVLLLVAAVAAGGGCRQLAGVDDLEFGDSGGDGGGGGGVGGGASTGTGVPPSCSPSEAAQPVPDDCGVFVAQTGDDSNPGTKDAPVETLAKAIELSAKGTKRVYACAEPFDEAVVLPAGISIFGGLDCDLGWKYAGAQERTKITPDADQIGLTILPGNEATRIEDVDVMAHDAEAPGGSSIAVVVREAAVTFARCEFVADDGAPGAKGSTTVEPAGPLDPADPSIVGAVGVAACTAAASSNAGGVGKKNGACSTSEGGNGGMGAIASGSDGDDGSPSKPEGSGLGGSGEVDAALCTNGTNGGAGQSGSSGAGAPSMPHGAISLAGYQGVPGKSGSNGQPGKGGGGGGGAKGKVGCGGASGGGGGAGGCGGKGGGGGKAGGSSIALISLNASLVFLDVTLIAGDGGAGGDGSGGQSGGSGGNGGMGGAPSVGTTAACGGGSGGPGGSGGQGGGGRGGHSIGIAFAGAAPMQPAAITTNEPGSGGLGSGQDGAGPAGVVQPMLDFGIDCTSPDLDGDGVPSIACLGTDCDDTNKDVFTGQTAYFSVPQPNGTFDYNCNGKEDMEFNAVECSGPFCPYPFDVFLDPNVECGQTGSFGSCSFSCKQSNVTTKTMRCR